MKKAKIVVCKLFGIAPGIMMLAILSAFSAGAVVITVNASGGGDYSSIQEAIDNAGPGDTILVYRDTYYENVNITKQLTLRGIGNPVVDAGGKGSAIKLSADGIILEGFSTTGSGSKQEAGIMVISKSNTLVFNNASSCKYGIFLASIGNNRISANNVSNNNIGIAMWYSGNNTLSKNKESNNNIGTYLESSSNNKLTENNATNNDIGIYVSSSDTNIINGNIASNNNIGIFFWDSFSNILKRNIASNNYYGIYLSTSGENTINITRASNNDVGIYLEDSSNNILGGNDASFDYYGIYLESSENNRLYGNNASINEYGIFLESSANNILNGNNASYNNYGIYLYWFSDNNTIYDNYFNNANNANDDGKNIWNINKTPGANIIRGESLGGNFWSDYAGKDTDGDGFGDTKLPYNSSSAIANGGDYYPLIPPALFAINININAIPVIGQMTAKIMNVEYANFRPGDPYNISIKSQNGTVVYYDSGNLTGKNPQIIPIKWTPGNSGNHTIHAWGRGINNSIPVYIYASRIVSPVPETGTIILVLAGILGLIGLRRRY